MISEAQELFRSGKVAEAVKILQGHLSRHPNDVPVLMQLAGIAANVGAVPQALSALRKVVQVDSRQGYAWFGIADRGWVHRFRQPGRPLYPDAWAGTGAEPAFAPGRVAHALGLRGPAVALDTTCSSALTCAPVIRVAA